MILRPKRALHELQGYPTTYPICGDIVRRLFDAFPELQIEQLLRERLRSSVLHQKLVLDTARRIDEVGRSGLRPYQRVGSFWLRRVKKGILADAPGLGKTVMSIDAAFHIRPKAPLVICHKAKIRDWEEHIKIWYDAKEEWTVTNYAQVPLTRLNPDLVIVDEAHEIRNRKTKKAKYIRSVTRRAEYVFLLTGSPTVNEESDIWTLLSICDPPRFSSYWGFAFRFLDVQHGYMGMEVGGVKESERGPLRQMVSPYLLRREGVLDLVKPKWRTIDFQLQGAQRDLYAQMNGTDRAEYRGDEMFALTSLSKITRLRQLALHPKLIFADYVGPSKLDALVPLLNERPGQVVIFSQYSTLIGLVAAHLGDQCITFTGGHSKTQRDDAITAFKRGDYRVIALTYGVGGESLDLQEADRVIMLEYPWHVAGIEQATGRVLRFGQKSDNVEFVTIHANNTVDDSILKIVKSKRRVTIHRILEGEMKRKLKE